MYAGYELFENVARPGAEENIDNEKYEYKPRDWAGAEKEGRSLALYLGILNEIRNAHPALGQLRNIRFHWSDDDAVLVYSKHLDGRFTPDGRDDTIIVVANVDPHSVRETTVHLDSPPSGSPPASASRSRTSSPGIAGTGAMPTSCDSTRSRDPRTSCTCAEPQCLTGCRTRAPSSAMPSSPPSPRDVSPTPTRCSGSTGSSCPARRGCTP